MVSGTGQKDFKNEGQTYSSSDSKSWKFNPPKPVEAQQKAPVWTPRRFSEVSIRLLCCGEGVALAVAISALDVNFNFRVFLSGS
ncbi:hypothetical protein TWF102_000835 [Orbilia oligospora]|uniref:Uncharacterized protein n=1 Tax=Orbilia oligospora TaxID=2813651 RepID=A0A7C8NFV8_ORBOL|nr:hypothetical protein TWF102_000835 [Orbilia oligospora]KAF3129260.1 hypothetical protein TWF594_011106 [Orbilia oligospora]